MTFKAMIAATALLIGASVSIANMALLASTETAEIVSQNTTLILENSDVVDVVTYRSVTPDVGTPLWIENVEMDIDLDVSDRDEAAN